MNVAVISLRLGHAHGDGAMTLVSEYVVPAPWHCYMLLDDSFEHHERGWNRTMHFNRAPTMDY